MTHFHAQSPDFRPKGLRLPDVLVVVCQNTVGQRVLNLVLTQSRARVRRDLGLDFGICFLELKPNWLNQKTFEQQLSKILGARLVMLFLSSGGVSVMSSFRKSYSLFMISSAKL